VRRRLRRWRALLRWRRFSLNGVPVLFANSFPKSGTHLLTQVLQGFPQIGPAVDSGLPAVVTFEGDSGRERPAAEILADLQRLLPGDLSYGHLHSLPQVVELLCQPGYAAYFILRDPRDVVVSHVHYVTEIEPNHIHHRYYAEVLQNFDQRLRTSILGLPDEIIPFPDIYQRFAPYLGWLEHPEVLCLRFEDFVTSRQETLRLVFDHAVQRGFPTALQRTEAIKILADNIDPQRSPTFRSGKIGGWQAQFSPENKTLFKEIAGDLLVRLDYEQDNDW
jgi:sulfotransferase 6B1